MRRHKTWKNGSHRSLDLPAHGQAEEGEEVDEQDGPVDGHVGRAGDGAHEGDGGGFGGRVPELELCGGLAASIWTGRHRITWDTISSVMRQHPVLNAARMEAQDGSWKYPNESAETSTHQEAFG